MKNATLLPKIILKKLPLLLGFIAFCIQSYAYPPVSIIYVKQNASGANNGTSWTDAYTSLQTAITNASAGTQIWVAAGTYKPTTGTDRDITFSLKNDVAIYGGFPNTGNPTFDDRNWHTNVTILSGEIGTSAVEDNSRRIIFNDNINSSAILDGFTIRDAYNTSTFSGAEGGGLRNQNSSPTILNCIFRNNNIANSGGGVANMSSSSPTYTNCLFIGNYAGYHGGAICSVDGSNPSFINCSFFGNTAGVRGGAVFTNTSGTNTTLKNCIVWGNTSSDNSVFYKSASTITVTYSLVQDGYTGTGNINTDPLFVDAANGNFRLQQCSPAINVGEDAANSTTLDLGKNTRKVGVIDMGAYEYQSAGGVPTAYAVNGSGDFCEGGTGVEITMSNVRPTVSYQLKRDNINVGTPIAGSLTTFGYHNQAGTYTVVATSLLNGCTNTMSNSISINDLPTAYNVGGGGSFCQGGTGVEVTLSGSQSGVNYQLKRDNANVGNAVAGTGNALSFGNQTVAGTYTVVATNASTSCTNDMSSSASVTVNDLPTAYNVGGGGSFCQGGTGVEITLSGSQSGVNYQLKRDNANVGNAVAGTGNALSFGNQTVAGTYTVVATNASTNCTNDMSSSASVTVNDLPTAYNVSGGGSFCQGGTGVEITLSGSQSGVNYQLKRDNANVGNVVAGTGNELSFSNQTVAGTYTVVATNASTSCTNDMSSSASVTVNDLPTAYNVGGGGSFCQGGTGVEVTLSGSQSGVNYQLKRDNANVGNAVAGTGNELSFGNQTVAGTYTVVATNASTNCTNDMSSSASVTVNDLPTAYNVGGGGSFCQGGTGVEITLSGSQSGVNYQLKRDNANVGNAVAGTGNELSFGNQTVAGTYTVVATNASTSCTNDMSSSASVTVNDLPTAYNVGGGGSFCQGGTGVEITLSGSQSGVNYQLKRDNANVGNAVAGTGNALSFGNQTVAGTYTVVATNASTSCTNDMNSSASVTVNDLPTAYNVGGGGSFCQGGTGVEITLSGSQSGVNYQLKRDNANVGNAVAGTGNELSFGNQTLAGTYTVVATNASTSCTNDMSSSASVTVNDLPTAYNVGGGGSFCQGGTGVEITLSGSQSGVNYQLKRDNANVGNVVAGTGNELSFGNQTLAGTYTVVATNASSNCTNDMSSSASVTVNDLPTAYNVSGGGSFCQGGTGVEITLSGSQSGVNYQLKRDNANVGNAVAGTGNALSFGNQTLAGTYTVVATNASTSCPKDMSSSASVTVNDLPTAYNVGGGGSFCQGGTGVEVTLSGSQSGVNYQLKRDNANVGNVVAGTGNALSFGNQTVAGTYTVVATNASTNCTNDMSSSASVTVNDLPTAYNVGGGGSFCQGGTGVEITLSGSQSGVNYQLKRDNANVGNAVAGTGNALSFGNQTVAGTYTVVATNASTNCTNDMSSSASVTVNDLPTAYNVGGGGSFCQGGTGVEITLSGSQSGVNYQLKRDNANVGNAVAGTGNALSFGNQTVAGTYTVVATNASTSCTKDMSSSASVTVNDLPTAYNVGGGGSFCQGGTGVEVTLSGSQSGVNYQLKRDNANVGNVVAGTGNALSFGNQTVTGTYTVVATNASTNCTNDMSSSASVIANAYPIAFTVGGGGSICNTQGGNAPSTAISLSSSESHVSYQLFHNNSPVGTPKNGTGNIIVFTGIQQSGNYTIEASIQGSCMATMNGSANVTIGITPTSFSLTGGGSYCKGGAGVSIGLSGSQEGFVYQLRRSNTNVGSPVAGTGSAISFGNQTLAGTYTVVATQATTSCTRNMTGSKTISIATCNARIASAEEVSLDNWAVVAPNPVGRHISVKLADVANQRVDFQLLNLTGQTLLSHHIYATIPNLTENLDIATLKPGIYLLNVKTLLKTTTIKVVKPE